jgi:protein-tyrosine phosphatase
MKVLFVCSGNAYRSPVAEALLKKQKPDIEVDSAGTFLAVPISKVAIKFLKKEGVVEYLKQAPESLENKKLDDYDLIVVMKQEHKNIIIKKCPQCEPKVVVWDIDDPFMKPIETSDRIFEQIKNKVIELANSL